MASFTLTIPGHPQTKGRPRFNTKTGHAHTDQRTRIAENDIRMVWREAGCPRLGEGALGVRLRVCFERPATHLLRSGDLSASGRRAPFPLRKPDGDNSLKLACDSLNGLAYRDDCQFVDIKVTKEWADRACVKVTMWDIDGHE